MQKSWERVNAKSVVTRAEEGSLQVGLKEGSLVGVGFVTVVLEVVGGGDGFKLEEEIFVEV